MYLNGLSKPLQGVLQLLAKKIKSVSSSVIKHTVNQHFEAEGCNAD